MDCSPPGSSVRDFPGKNTGVGYHFLLQGINLTQISNQCLLFAAGFFTTEPPGKLPIDILNQQLTQDVVLLRYWGTSGWNWISHVHNNIWLWLERFPFLSLKCYTSAEVFVLRGEMFLLRDTASVPYVKLEEKTSASPFWIPQATEIVHWKGELWCWLSWLILTIKGANIDDVL